VSDPPRIKEEEKLTRVDTMGGLLGEQEKKAEAPTRCEGRYPVPSPRDEPFLVTYRCALADGHQGPHGAEPTGLLGDQQETPNK
jgi:hypothetical protein